MAGVVSDPGNGALTMVLWQGDRGAVAEPDAFQRERQV